MSESKISKAQQRAVNKYIEKNYDRINLTVPKGRKEEIKDHADSCGESVNGFIIRAINETMNRDNETTAANAPQDGEKNAPGAPGLHE